MYQWMIEPGVRHVLEDHLAGVESFGRGLGRSLLNLCFDLHPLSIVYRRLLRRGPVAREQALETERLEEE